MTYKEINIKMLCDMALRRIWTNDRKPFALILNKNHKDFKPGIQTAGSMIDYIFEN